MTGKGPLLMAETAEERLARWRSIGVLSKGRTQSRVIEEGRAHPESGEPFKTVRDELNNDVTEHGARGSGVSDRQDVNIRAPHITRSLDE